MEKKKAQTHADFENSHVIQLVTLELTVSESGKIFQTKKLTGTCWINLWHMNRVNLQPCRTLDLSTFSLAEWHKVPLSLRTGQSSLYSAANGLRVFWFFWKQPVSFTFQNSSHNPDLIVPFSSIHQKTDNPRSQLDRKSDLGWRVMPCILRILSRNLEERYRSPVCSRVRKPSHSETTKAIQNKNCWTLGTGN